MSSGTLCGRFVVAIGLSLLAACATPPTDPEDRADFEAQNDPAEPTNRAIFDANQALDRNAIKPAAEAYRDNVPEGVRHSVHNFVTNLREPLVGVNDLLQGNFGQFWITLQRFVVNTTIGAGGLFDPAGQQQGLPHHDSDFGQTFGVWGVGEGPFVELPVLGPSNVRDATGTALGFVLDPIGFIGSGATVTNLTYARAGTDGLDKRTEYLPYTDQIEKSALDLYAQYRSLYRQHRAGEIQRGKNPDGETTPEDKKLQVIMPDAAKPDAAKPDASGKN